MLSDSQIGSTNGNWTKIASKLTLKNVMSSLILVLLVFWIPGITVVIWGPPFASIFILTLTAVIVVFALCFFAFFAIKNPAALMSEEHQQFHLIMGTLGDNEGTVIQGDAIQVPNPASIDLGGSQPRTDLNVVAVHQYITDASFIAGWAHYIPGVYFLRSHLSLNQLREKFDTFLRHDFVIVFTSPQLIDGRLSKDAWEWVHEKPNQMFEESFMDWLAKSKGGLSKLDES